MPASELRPVLGGAVLAHRRRAGWRQTDLAERLGWPVSRIARLERGDCHLRVEDLPDLCRAFGVPLGVLLDGAPEETLQALGLPRSVGGRS